ncbi:MAG: single-stranded DNA-binding protein [Chloroflexia bacterium]
MSRSLNKVQLIGRLGGDPELKYTQAGMARVSFSVATDRSWQDKEGNRRDETDWHAIIAWDKLAETCANYLSKGRLIYIEGRLQTRSWEFEGKTGTKTEIVAQNMLILDSKGNGVAEPTPEPEYTPVEVQAPVRSASRQATPTTGRASGVPSSSARTSSSAGRTMVVDPEDDPEDLPF